MNASHAIAEYVTYFHGLSPKESIVEAHKLTNSGFDPVEACCRHLERLPTLEQYHGKKVVFSVARADASKHPTGVPFRVSTYTLEVSAKRAG